MVLFSWYKDMKKGLNNHYVGIKNKRNIVALIRVAVARVISISL